MAAGQLMLSRASMHAHYVPDILGPYFMIGVGIGFVQVALQIAAFAGVEDADAGLVRGVLETASEVGGVLGVAVIASLASARFQAFPRADASHAVALTQAFHRASLACALVAVAGSLAVLVVGPTRRRRRPAALREQGEG